MSFWWHKHYWKFTIIFQSSGPFSFIIRQKGISRNIIRESSLWRKSKGELAVITFISGPKGMSSKVNLNPRQSTLFKLASSAYWYSRMYHCPRNYESKKILEIDKKYLKLVTRLTWERSKLFIGTGQALDSPTLELMIPKGDVKADETAK